VHQRDQTARTPRFAQRVAVAVEEMTPLEELGELAVKGLTQPVVAFNVPGSGPDPG